MVFVILSVRTKPKRCTCSDTHLALQIAIIPEKNSSYIISFVDPSVHFPSSFVHSRSRNGTLHSISSILSSRFLLALHETKAQLEGAADTTISSFCLDTGSGNNPSALASPELPPFLGPIGGVIRSFHDDDDEDMESLEFAPLELCTESGFELGGDILESGGSDAGNSMA